MDRRKFFQSALLGTAGVVIAPKLFSQIVEHPYEKPPEELFVDGEGLWLFRKDKLVAFSHKHGVTIQAIPRYTIENTSSEFPSPEGYSMYLPGPMEVWYTVENLNVLDNSILNLDGEVFHLIMKMKYTIDSDVIITEFGLDAFADGMSKRTARFTCTGESVVIIDDARQSFQTRRQHQ